MRRIKKITIEYDDGTIDIQDTGLPEEPIDLTKTWPYTYKPVVINNDAEEFCAIREYFKSHPGETSVMMTCSCKRCTPWFHTHI
jgi:hypothetical protein